MGVGGSKGENTPLECMLNNFKKAFSGAYGVKMTPERLRTLCELEWPKQNTGWPSQGTFDINLVSKLWTDIAKETGGCPEQFSYIDSWLSTLNNNPSWIRKCKVKRCKLLAVKAEARKGILPNKLKPIFEGPEEEVLSPPPYAPRRGEPNPNTPPVVTPRQETGMNNGGGVTELDSLIDYDKYLQEALESYNKAQAEVVIPPVTPNRPPSTVSFSGTTDCPPQTPVHPSPREILQKLQGDLDRSASNTARRIKLLKERLGTDTIPYDLRPLEQSEEKGHVVAPLRRVFDALEEPVLVNGQPGPRPPRTSTLQYIPFTTTDLMNWKTHTPSFAEKPQAMMDLVTSIVNTHSPTWTDCRQLLNTLFTTEERRDIIEKAQIYLREQARVGNIFNIDRHLQDNFPLEDPNWDPNNAIHLARLTTYRQTLVQGIRRACQKPTNMSKVSEVEQKPNESPGDFLERLQEAYRIWTPFDPEAPENSRMITATFVAQCASDIRKKIQKSEGWEGMLMSQIMAIARRVYRNRDEAEKQEKKKWQKEKMVMLATAVKQDYRPLNGGRGRGKNPPLGRNQCANCKKEGHWKRECPEPLRLEEVRPGPGPGPGPGSGPRNQGRGRGMIRDGRYQRPGQGRSRDNFIGLAEEDFTQD